MGTFCPSSTIVQSGRCEQNLEVANLSTLHQTYLSFAFAWEFIIKHKVRLFALNTFLCLNVLLDLSST